MRTSNGLPAGMGGAGEAIRTRCRWVLVACASIVAIGGADAGAEPAVAKGRAIAAEADRRDRGFGNYAADVVMVLSNRNGTESRRALRIKVLEVDGDGDKSLIRFSRPRDIEGTALLTFSHRSHNDDQWIFLPALKRVKRISSTNKSSPFVGSEFAYEDLVSQEVEKYSYEWLRNEEIDGAAAFVVERKPVNGNSGYARQVVWFDMSEYRILKIDYYDRKNDLLKTFRADGYKRYLGKFWRASRMVMDNHQTGKSTRLSWRGYDFRTTISRADFNKGKLKRAR